MQIEHDVLIVGAGLADRSTLVYVASVPQIGQKPLPAETAERFRVEPPAVTLPAKTSET